MYKSLTHSSFTIVPFFSFFLISSCAQIDLPEEVESEYVTIEEEIDFNRDVKKILSDKCFTCHGPDAKKQKADLRLDLADFAYEHVAESGLKAIKPGSIARSELVQRILSEDPEYQMPTPESHLQLTPREKAILIKWIDQGAEYKPHWAFVAPQKEEVPDVQHDEWVDNNIDQFIVNKLEKKGMKPAPETDRETLIRRLSFDIRGIAPSLQEIDAFVASKDPKAFEKVVENFLASKHFGERMAAYWLDLARFADSHGYLDDKHHEVSPWRDWVISAFNRNIPFDQFVTWQMAGDLIPSATKEQVLATGFNRMHKQNSEAGIIEEEFRVEYVVDRTNTLGTAMMAMTLGCAKCHDHKYDPISQKDYYSLYAFFNNTFEKGSPNYGGPDVVAGPTLRLTSAADDKKISLLSRQIANLEKMEASKVEEESSQLEKASGKQIASRLSEKLITKLDFDRTRKQKDKEYFVNATGSQLDAVVRKAEMGEGVVGKSLLYNDQTVVAFEPYKLAYFERYDPFAFSFWIKVPENYPLATVFHASDPHRYGYQGYDLVIKENRLNFRLNHAFPHDAISVFAKQKLIPNQWYHVAVSYSGSSKASGVSFFLNGKKVTTETEYDNLYKNIRSYPNIHKTSRYQGLIFGKRDLDRSMPGGQIDEFHVFNNVLFPAEVSFLYQKKSFDPRGKKRNPDSSALMLARKSLCDLYDSTKEVMVMGDLPKPRKAHVLIRGNYTSYGDPVEPATPAAILPFDEKYPKNRLGLSMWLFDERNPLTARVAVNRIWQLIFGKGLVKTSDDFGNQGEIPLHQDLLDHLAIWYREHGWDTKALMRYIFMSKTYRQSSLTESKIVKLDPNNDYYTRNPRYRFPAEMIRDNALSIAGLLSQKIGGPSVYPYQPEGLWDELSDKGWRYRYVVSEGEDRFRKSIYTVRKRTSVVPFLQIFDAPDRSVCTVKRQKSSSPMQSLAMLNDPQMIEAARFVGLRMLTVPANDLVEQLQFGFRLVTGRIPDSKELALLRKMYEAELKNFIQRPEKAEAYLCVGTMNTNYQDRSSLAAMSSIALAIMNTDEYLTRK